MNHFTKLLICLTILANCLILIGQDTITIYEPLKYHTQAHKYMEQEQYIEAAREFARIHPNDTLYNQALYNRAVSLRTAGQCAEAMSLIEEGITLNKEYVPDFYINKAYCLDSLEKYEEVFEVLDQASKRYPFNNSFDIARGWIHESRGEYYKAMKIYMDGIRREPLRQMTHLRLANLMYHSNAISQAVLPITVAIAINPEAENNYNLLRMLESIVSSKADREGRMGIDDIGGDFGDVDALIGNYIALSDKYEVPSKIQYGYIKQLHLLLSEADPEADDFFTDTYIRPLQSMLDEKKFGSFAGLLSMSSNNEEHQKYCKDNFDDIVSIYSEIQEIYTDKYASHISKDPDIPGTLRYSYDEEGKVNSYGVYDKNKGTFIGHHKYINQNGGINCVAEFDKDGIETGEWIWYHENGKIARKSKIKKGKLHGPTSYFSEDDILLSTYNYDQGILEGKTDLYKLIGYKYEELQYKKDAEHGPKNGYFPDGTIRYKYNMKEGKEDGMYQYYFDDGALSYKGLLKEGYRDQTYTSYYRDGRIEYEENYKDQDLEGPFVSYYKSGQLKMEGQFKKGKRSGIWKKYRPNGHLETYEEYDNRGKKNGIVKNYDHLGRLENEYKYNMGVVEKVMNYDEAGNVTSTYNKEGKTLKYVLTRVDGTKMVEGTQVDGKMQGEVILYNPYGKKASSEMYKDDLLDGPLTTYQMDETILSVTNYSEGLANGLYVSYFPLGTIAEQYNYQNDMLEGRYTKYTVQGHVTYDTYYDDSQEMGITSYYNPDESVYLKEEYNLGYLVGGTRYDTSGNESTTFTLNKGNGEDRYYFQDKETPLGINRYLGGERHGEQPRYFSDGSMRSVSTYHNSYLHGPYVGYHRKDVLAFEGEYQYGDLVGIFKYYDWDGNLVSTTPVEYGETHGIQKTYYPNGKLESTTEILYGSRQGPATYYAPSGEVAFVLHFVDDYLVSINYKNADDQLTKPTPINADAKTITTKYKAGGVSAIIQYEHGTKHGEAKRYHTDGTPLAVETFYLNQLHGTQRYYHANGKLRKEVEYNQGVQQGLETTYYENGNVKTVCPFIDDERHGKMHIYDQSGNKIETYVYFGDIPYATQE